MHISQSTLNMLFSVIGKVDFKIIGVSPIPVLDSNGQNVYEILDYVMLDHLCRRNKIQLFNRVDYRTVAKILNNMPVFNLDDRYIPPANVLESIGLKEVYDMTFVIIDEEKFTMAALKYCGS